MLWLCFQVNQENDEEVAKIDVPVAQRGDTGKYKIKLKNANGEDTGDINVIVLGNNHMP